MRAKLLLVEFAAADRFQRGIASLGLVRASREPVEGPADDEDDTDVDAVRHPAPAPAGAIVRQADWTPAEPDHRRSIDVHPAPPAPAVELAPPRRELRTAPPAAPATDPRRIGSLDRR